MNKMKKRTKKIVSCMLAAILLLQFIPNPAANAKERPSEMVMEAPKQEEESVLEKETVMSPEQEGSDLPPEEQEGFAFSQDTVTFQYVENGEYELPEITGGSGDGDVSYEVTQGAEGITITESNGKMLLENVAKAGKAVITAKKGEDSAQCTVIFFADRELSFADGDNVEVSLGQPYRKVVRAKADDGTEWSGDDQEFQPEVMYSVVSGDAASVGTDGTLVYQTDGIGDVTIKAEIPATEFYSGASRTFTVTIGYETTDSDAPYTIDGDIGNDGWYTSGITVTPISGYKISKSNVPNASLDNNTWEDSVNFKEEGEHNYTFYLRKIEDGELAGITDAFTVQDIRIDSEKPVSHISYNQPVNAVGGMKFYYQDMVQVTLEAEDVTSGMESFIYYTDGVSEGKGTKVTVPEDFSSDGHWTKQGNLVSYTFEIPAQYKGSISFSAVDIAGNGQDVVTDGKEMLVVDNIKAGLKINYDGREVRVSETADAANALQVIKDYIYHSRTDVNLYYDRDAALEITIAEENFDAEDVELKINGVPVSQMGNAAVLSNWKASTDFVSGRTENTAVLTMKEDGDYVVTLAYEDRSKNGRVYYQSEHIIVDKKAPEVDVSYPESQSVRDGIIYYNGQPQAVITVTETNFNPADMAVRVTAKDANGQEVTVFTEDAKGFVEYLKMPDNWTSDGNVHTAVITYNKDADYVFSMEYEDMAGHKSSYSGEKDDYGEDIFTVDNAPMIKTDQSYDEMYQGNIVCIVDENGEELESAQNALSRYICDGEVFVSMQFEEAHFYSEDANVDVLVTRDGKTVAAEGCDVSWKDMEDKKFHVLSVHIGAENADHRKDGDYQITVNYTDCSGNKMEAYSSNVITIDTTVPVIGIRYENNESENEVYYDAARVAYISVTDRNIRPEEIIIKVSGKDVEGNPIRVSGKQSSWQRDVSNTNLWTCSVTCDTNANYDLSVQCVDMAGHKAGIDDSFTVDMEKPKTEKFQFDYSESILDKVIRTVSFGYYNPDVMVTVTAEDTISGIDCLEWIYERDSKGSDSNVKEERGKITRQNLTFSDGGRTAVGKFKLSASKAKQYRGHIRFRAVDMAGNTSSYKTDDGRMIVVDSITPTRSVTYSPAKQVINKTTQETLQNFDYSSEKKNVILYYDSDMKLTLMVEEANFYKEDVTVKVNGKTKKVMNWKQKGDVWSADVTISGKGDYVVTMDYSDRSSNRMKHYTSGQITIDKDRPEIDVSYLSEPIDTINGHKYYNNIMEAQITIKEHNFRASDVEVSVTAGDVGNGNVSVEDYAAYLKKPGSWKTDGDIHTAVISYSQDANYSFEISYHDLALREAASHGDTFTMDTKKPENLNISYSRSVFETVIDTITFGFYNAQATVTLTADDMTSGINEFRYSYLKANGVSGVNSELTDGIITENEIEYSNNGKTATAEFRIPSDALRGDNQFNGTVQFTAIDRCRWEEEFIDTRHIVVDNIAPTAEITFNAPIKEDNGISYYDGAVSANIDITEANFYPEDVTVSVSKDGGGAAPVNVAWSEAGGDHHSGSFTLSEDGDYVVYVSYEDRSNNVMEEYHSEQITVDTASPTVTVDGIRNHSANKDAQIGFTVTVDDINFDISTFKPNLTAQVQEEDGTIHTVDMSEMGEVKSIVQGSRYAYTVTNIEKDGVYKLSCTVGDLADNQKEDMQIADSGNEETKILLFSVNRNGSTYMLDNVTSDLNGSFSTEERNVTVTEINVDELSDSEITLYKNDETRTLEEGGDYTVEASGSEETWHTYVYTVLKDNFKEDGIYRLALFSEDKAGNFAGNTLETKKAEISFGIDKTAPNLIVANLEEDTTYPLEELNVIMQANDNIKLSSVEVKLDGKPSAFWDEAAIEKMDKSGEDYTFTVPGNATFAHSAEFVLEDLAGNRTVQKIGNFYVTTNLFVRFYNNKKLFYGCIAAVLAVILIPCIVFGAKRRKKENADR